MNGNGRFAGAEVFGSKHMNAMPANGGDGQGVAAWLAALEGKTLEQLADELRRLNEGG
jgi:hypothetical protein